MENKNLSTENFSYQNRLLTNLETVSTTRISLNYSRVMSAEQCFKALLTAFKGQVNSCSNWIEDEQQITKIKQIAQELTRRTKRNSIILQGIPGSGKTNMLLALKAFIWHSNINDYRKSRDTGRNERLYLYTWNARDIVSIYLSDKKAYKELVNHSLLGIDDLGLELENIKQYGNDYYPIAELIYKRYELGLPIFLSTNLPFRAREDNMLSIESVYGSRIASRLNEVAKRLTFSFTDYRNLSKEE